MRGERLVSKGLFAAARGLNFGKIEGRITAAIGLEAF
jgi:hypothetical protein